MRIIKTEFSDDFEEYWNEEPSVYCGASPKEYAYMTWQAATAAAKAKALSILESRKREYMLDSMSFQRDIVLADLSLMQERIEKEL